MSGSITDATIPGASGGSVDFYWFDPATNSWVSAGSAAAAIGAAETVPGDQSGVAFYGKIGAGGGAADGPLTLSGLNDFFDGRGGGDSVSGGEGNDLLIGRDGADSLVGGGGDDTILAGGATSVLGNVVLGTYTIDGAVDDGGAADTILGGEGNDFVFGAGDNDFVEGGGGADTLAVTPGANLTVAGFENVSLTDTSSGTGVNLTFGDGNDSFAGGAGADTITGGGGNDTLLGGDGADRLQGGAGDDSLDGGAGNDTVSGNEGSDSLEGGADADSLDGSAGQDSLSGGAGADTLDGGGDADTLTGGLGNDRVTGGDGDDTFAWSGGDGNDTVSLGGGNNTLDLQGWDGGTPTGNGTFGEWEVTFSNGGATATFTNTTPGGGSVTVSDWTAGTNSVVDGSLSVICFYPGTLIATPAGPRAVETLAIGDLVLTAAGEARPVRWMGRQTVSTRFGDPLRVLPIRVRGGALGAGLPARDLLVSPAHALLLDGVLVQAGALVNGITITHETEVPEVFTYHHVELAAHELILAEGVPAESYVDSAERVVFDNRAEHAALYGDLPPIEEMDLPRATSARQVPAATRQRLAAIAAARAATAA